MPPKKVRGATGGPMIATRHFRHFPVTACITFRDTDFARMHGFQDALEFQQHEWNKHGMCAGIVDADDFFGHTLQVY